MPSKVEHHRRGSPRSTVQLYGREKERAVLENVLEHARASASSVLVLRGPAGIGKSALLADVAARADGFRILEATGLESESGLAFAGLHQLLRPLIGLLDQIPKPQAAALRSALGLAPAGGEEPFLVGAGLVSLLAVAAEDMPLFCLIEDAHWLDTPSASALIFAARRLDAERIAIVMAAREDERSFETSGLPELVLGGLDSASASALVAARVLPAPAPGVRDELIDRARGNPLALLELPLALTPEELAGAAPLADPLPLTEVLEDAFLARVISLPDESQKLLLIVAADNSVELEVVDAVSVTLGFELAALEACEADGLVRVSEGGIEFRHPLVRSAVYQHATFPERRAVHRALARVFLDERDADRRAWHLAAGASGPDNEVADELERSAERAEARGGHASAAATLSRAAALTADDEARARRQLAAAEAAARGGQIQVASALAEEARRGARDPLLRADIERQRGLIEVEARSPVAGCQIFLASAAEVEEHDEERASRLLLDAASAAVYGGDLRAQLEIYEQSERLRSRNPRSFELAVATAYGMIWKADFGRAADLLREAVALSEASDNPRRFLWAAVCSVHLGDEPAAGVFANRDAALARREGAVGALVQALARVALAEIAAGKFSSARANATEGLSLAEGAGLDTVAGYHRGLLAWIAALLGHADEATKLAEETLEFARVRGKGWQAGLATLALGDLELGLGRPAEALRFFETLSTPGSLAAQPYLSLYAAPNLIEAAVRAGQPAAAHAMLARFANWVTSVRSAAHRPLLARCRALVATDDSARRHFEHALRLHARTERCFEVARTEHLFGAWLRRAGLRREARRHLRVAFQLFEQRGANAWADQAAAELRASGEKLRRRGPIRTDELTPQELQVARFVSTGVTNREVAEQLFLSPRTVDAHLRNIFRKLEITSRAQLGSLGLGETPGEAM